MEALDELRQARVGLGPFLDRLRKDGETLQRVQRISALVPIVLSPAADAATVSANIRSLKAHARKTIGPEGMALLNYLLRMRELARNFPILIVLQHLTARSSPASSNDIQRALISAIIDANEAIRRLHEEMFRPVIPRAERKGEAPATVELAEAISQAGRLSVWKLPFFMEKALIGLPDDERPSVGYTRIAALYRTEKRLAMQKLTSIPIDLLVTGALLACGPIGAVLGLALAIPGLSGSFAEYEEMNALYHASLDPAFLALGDEGHEPPSVAGLAFDVFLLLFGLRTAPKDIRAAAKATGVRPKDIEINGRRYRLRPGGSLRRLVILPRTQSATPYRATMRKGTISRF